MSTPTHRMRSAAVVAIAPLVLFSALFLHPHLPGRQPNIEALAEAVSMDPTRWGLVHLATGLGSAVLAVVFLTIRSHLYDAGERRWSGRGLPLVMVGSTLYAMLPAMEFAPLAAVESGGNPQAAQEALVAWFVPVLVASGLTFGAGMVCFAVSVVRSGIASVGISRLIAAALVAMAVSRLIPFSAVQFHVQGIACYAALLPLAYIIWRQPAPPRVSPGAEEPAVGLSSP